MIKSLFISVRKAWSFNIEPPKYSAIETLSFTEHSLAFIKSEFSKQIFNHGKRKPDATMIPYNHYNIATDGPYFDSHKFRVAARELLFSARNLGQVTTLFKHYRRVAIELVNLWNDKLYFIEQEIRADGPPIQPTMVNVELTREFKTWWHHDDDLAHFNILYPQLFTNQNFAYYAAHIANLLPSATLQHTQEVMVRDGIPDFMINLKTALKILLVQNNADCIENVKRGNHWEAPFRDWFDQSFTFLGYTCSRESIRGKGHIDLHVHTQSEGDKIIEFKGWWDSTRRKTVVQQVCQYLTQFEGDGYIVMINHTQKPIDLAYQKIVCTKASGYVSRSWKKHRAGKGIRYYSSRHRSASGEKEVYHFIISIF
jgi:hypothetical protein